MDQSVIIPVAGMAPPSETKASGQGTAPGSFVNFIWREKVNRTYLWIAIGGTLVQFIIFKLLYPFPDFFSDSYSYLFAAYANLDVSIWPIGYSKFLRAFHFLTYSDTALIACQYFLLELGALYFFFTILYFFKPVRTNRVILFVFLFFNPLFLYLSNYVNSDPLFAALSLFWFTQLIWIMYQPKIYQIFVQAILLFLCFTIRNNAYYYPLIAIIAFLLSKQRNWLKLAGIILPFILIIPFILHTRNEAFKMTGTKQFSLFTGWQLANNALYMFEYTDSAENLSPSVRELDTLTRQFYRFKNDDFHQYLSHYVGNYFIRESNTPLKYYLRSHYKATDEYSLIIAWAKSSEVFEEYGKYLITHNLNAYIWEFMLPNSRNYLFPPLEKLEIYNLGMDTIDEIAKYWFHYKTDQIHSISKNAQGIILYVFPLLFFFVTLFFLGSTIWFYTRKAQSIKNLFYTRTIFLSVAFQVVNFLFCISSTIIVFRYQFFPLLLCIVTVLLLTEYMDKSDVEKSHSYKLGHLLNRNQQA